MNFLKQITSTLTVLIIIPISIKSNWSLHLGWSILGMFLLIMGLLVMVPTIFFFYSNRKKHIWPMVSNQNIDACSYL